MKDKISMPLIEAMLQYKSENVYPLHTPGHKGGRGMQRLLRQELGASVQMDVSLMSELDDIHEPETYIKEAQELAAQTYGSDACFWAVNGTSQAIHAMLLTALNPGKSCCCHAMRTAVLPADLFWAVSKQSICNRSISLNSEFRCRLPCSR